MEEKREHGTAVRAVAKKFITPMMKEWQPVSPKMPSASDAELPREAALSDNPALEGSAAEGSELGSFSSEGSALENFESESSESEDFVLEDPVLESSTDSEAEDSALENAGLEDSILEDSELEGSILEDSASGGPEPAIEPVDEEPHSRVALSDNKSGMGMGWYVVHTYSGYENKVKANIEKAIENRHLENEILEVRVPLQDVTEVKDGVEKSTQKKLFPGYVLLHMDADNNDAWYVVRNTRGVTGFVGPGSKPVPLTDEELRALDFTSEVSIAFDEGDIISVTAGVWKDTVGTIQKIDAGRQTVTINVEMFGRETPVEINFTDVKKIS